MRAAFVSAALAAACAASSAFAEVPAREPMVCPIGGESFVHIGYAAYSTYGARLDGKPYGSTSFPLRIPECPSNHFIVYKQTSDFTPEQVSALIAFMATPDYAALSGETTYYRASRLARAANEPLDVQAWLMLEATWQADTDVNMHRRYQDAFLELADAALAQLPRSDQGWWSLQFRAANAERQSGRFDAAIARLDALPMNELAALAGEDAEGMSAGFPPAVTRLRSVIEAHDASLEPASLNSER